MAVLATGLVLLQLLRDDSPTPTPTPSVTAEATVGTDSPGPTVSPTVGPSPPAPSPSPPTPTVGTGRVVGDYTCLTLEDAEARIERDGFRVGEVTYSFEGGPVDETWVVDRHEPPPSEMRPPDSSVDLWFVSPFFADC